MAGTVEPSPFQCSVCFNDKQKRQPRCLPCLHSFCTDCLTTWHEQRCKENMCHFTSIECPTCRTKATLPPGGVAALPIDINVEQFADFMSKSSGGLLCSPCKKVGRCNKGAALCKPCNRLFCDDCGDAHAQIDVFSSHQMTRNICKLHGAAFQCICCTCLCGACFDCVYSESHNGHVLKDVSGGVTEIRQAILESTTSLEKCVATLEKEIADKLDVCGEKFCGAEQNLKHSEETMKLEVDKIINEALREHKKIHEVAVDEAFAEHLKVVDEARMMTAQVKEHLDKDDETVLANSQSVDIDEKLTRGSVQVALNSLPCPGLISKDCCRLENVDQVLEALRSCKPVCGIGNAMNKSGCLPSPVLVLEVKCVDGQDIVNPWRLCGTPQGDVIVCSYDGGNVYRVSKDGRKTTIHDDGRVACEYNDDIYLISKDGTALTQIKSDKSEVTRKINPPASNPRGLAVYGDRVFILKEQKVITRSLTGPECETIHIEGAQCLNAILLDTSGGKTKFIITDDGTDKVIFCDVTGTVQYRFGDDSEGDESFRGPEGITMMSNGHLLVADWGYNRIAEFQKDGTFVRNVLTAAEGVLEPVDVVFRFPYLWVAQNMGDSEPMVKLFKFKYK